MLRPKKNPDLHVASSTQVQVQHVPRASIEVKHVGVCAEMSDEMRLSSFRFRLPFYFRNDVDTDVLVLVTDVQA